MCYMRGSECVHIRKHMHKKEIRVENLKVYLCVLMNDARWFDIKLFFEKHSKLFTQATPPLNDSADFHTHYLVPYYWIKFLKVNVYAKSPYYWIKFLKVRVYQNCLTIALHEVSCENYVSGLDPVRFIITGLKIFQDKVYYRK